MKYTKPRNEEFCRKEHASSLQRPLLQTRDAGSAFYKTKNLLEFSETKYLDIFSVKKNIFWLKKKKVAKRRIASPAKIEDLDIGRCKDRLHAASFVSSTKTASWSECFLEMPFPIECFQMFPNVSKCSLCFFLIRLGPNVVVDRSVEAIRNAFPNVPEAKEIIRKSTTLSGPQKALHEEFVIWQHPTRRRNQESQRSWGNRIKGSKELKNSDSKFHFMVDPCLKTGRFGSLVLISLKSINRKTVEKWRAERCTLSLPSDSKRKSSIAFSNRPTVCVVVDLRVLNFATEFFTPGTACSLLLLLPSHWDISRLHTNPITILSSKNIRFYTSISAKKWRGKHHVTKTKWNKVEKILKTHFRKYFEKIVFQKKFVALDVWKRKNFSWAVGCPLWDDTSFLYRRF